VVTSEIKLKQNNFVSDVVTCEMKQKQNTETILTRCSAIAERPRCRVRYSFRQK